LAMLILMK